MTPKKLFAVLIVAAALLSCSKDKTGGSNEGPDGPLAPVRVVATLDDVVSRAVTFPGEAPEGEEGIINNIAIFAFNNQRVLKLYEPIVYNGSTTASLEFELPVGQYYFYAVANIPRNYYDFEVGTLSMSDFIETELDFTLLTLTNEDKPGDALTRGFFMTNKDNAIPKYVMETTNAADNLVTIPLGRAVAKVAVAFDPAVSSQPDGELHDVQYKVVNNPARMYVMTNYAGNALKTPNYNKTSILAADYQEPRDDYQDAIVPGTVTPTYTYCMENSNFVPREGNAAMVLLKGVFEPKFLLDEQGNDYTGTYNKGDVFYRIRTINDSGSKYFEADPTSVYGKYFAEQPDPSFLQPNTVDNLTYELVEYPNAECYYPIWLKNSDSGADNVYTVKRNSYYRVRITGVNGAGVPDTDGGIDPDEPLDKQAPGRGMITVEDWDAIDQEEQV